MRHKRTMAHMSCHHSAREVLELPYCTNIPESIIIERGRLLPCNRAVIYIFIDSGNAHVRCVCVSVCVWGGGGQWLK